MVNGKVNSEWIHRRRPKVDWHRKRLLVLLELLVLLVLLLYDFSIRWLVVFCSAESHP
jgi:hypothetical protein